MPLTQVKRDVVVKDETIIARAYGKT